MYTTSRRATNILEDEGINKFKVVVSLESVEKVVKENTHSIIQCLTEKVDRYCIFA